MPHGNKKNTPLYYVITLVHYVLLYYYHIMHYVVCNQRKHTTNQGLFAWQYLIGESGLDHSLISFQVFSEKVKKNNNQLLVLNKGADKKIFQGGCRRQNSSGGWVTGNIFQDIFMVGITLFLNTYGKKTLK